MKGKLFLPALILALLLQATGCGGAAMHTPSPEAYVDMPRVPALLPVEVVEEYGKGGGPAVVVPAEERLIIRMGDISLLVEDTEESLAKIEALALELGGFVVNSNSWKVNDALHATITIRVPAESFEEARRRIKEGALEVQSENTSAQDVTEEYVDLESRLTSLEETEGELHELLRSAQERGEKAEGILAIYQELSNIGIQVEQAKGRMQYLERSAAMSALTVNLTPKEEVQVVEPGWDWLRTVRESLRDLVKALQLLADIATGFIITILPILIILALPFALLGWLVAWLFRRRRAKKE
ncbi:MAG: DUF4349 domain-containing protein, partial [Anaerolineae bacterium]|nr:DUF4349 domain-containing protein [Anaerolineae bacterium]